MVDYHRNALIRRHWIHRTGFGIFLSGATSCNLGSKVVEDSLDGLEIRLLGVRGHAEEDLFLDVGEEQGCVGHNSYEGGYMTMMDKNIPLNQCRKTCRDLLAIVKALDGLTQAPLCARAFQL